MPSSGLSIGTSGFGGVSGESATTTGWWRTLGSKFVMRHSRGFAAWCSRGFDAAIVRWLVPVTTPSTSQSCCFAASFGWMP
eukprot:26170-Alexandrium_andersonii.AAC.1